MTFRASAESCRLHILTFGCEIIDCVCCGLFAVSAVATLVTNKRPAASGHRLAIPLIQTLRMPARLQVKGASLLMSYRTAAVLLGAAIVIPISFASMNPLQADTGAKSDKAAVSLLPPPPSGTATVMGGVIRDLDPVRDQFKLDVFGEWRDANSCSSSNV